MLAAVASLRRVRALGLSVSAGRGVARHEEEVAREGGRRSEAVRRHRQQLAAKRERLPSQCVRVWGFLRLLCCAVWAVPACLPLPLLWLAGWLAGWAARFASATATEETAADAACCAVGPAVAVRACGLRASRNSAASGRGTKDDTGHSRFAAEPTSEEREREVLRCSYLARFPASARRVHARREWTPSPPLHATLLQPRRSSSVPL